MSDNSVALGSYAAVLADLRAKRDHIDRLIRDLEQVASAGLVSSPPAEPASQMPHSSGDTVFDGAFFGLTVADAAKKALGLKRKPLHSSDLVPLLRQGGIVMNSADPSNTVNSILSRRFNDVGDIVRVERSTWGLREWYPHTNFGRKKDPTSKDVVEQASAPAVQPTDEV